ncbi:MAG: radical SAM protein [Dysgonamonadaceae bacterium]|jgi:ribosomal protein S12 methylthiotransferase|nr:radical SAM protein [Dysgonamonadaceae bacterium]
MLIANNIVEGSKEKIKLYAGLVCPRRSMDYRKLEKYFMLNGCEIVSDPNLATHIVIVTCGFIERNIQESLKILEYARKTGASVIVAGCLPDIDSKRLENYKISGIITTKEIERIDSFFPDFAVKFRDVVDANELHDYHEIDSICGKRDNYIEKCFYDRYEFEYKIKTFLIRIADGCNCKYSYCSHRDAIGVFRSKSMETCINEYKKGLENGFRVFRITAMDTGHYGIDIKTNLPALIDKFLSIDSEVQFILDDLNPVWLVKYGDAIADYCKNGKIRMVSIPIQSGSPSVLKQMKRYTKTEELKSISNKIKTAYPALNFMTEILVGFPGESESDFDATLNFLFDAHIDYAYFYPYYENERIDSASIYPKNSSL